MKLQLKNKLRYSLYAVLCAVLLSSCNEAVYTNEQCKSFQYGDTVFVREFYTIEKYIVIENHPDLEIVELKDARYDWRVNTLEYDQLRFK